MFSWQVRSTLPQPCPFLPPASPKTLTSLPHRRASPQACTQPQRPRRSTTAPASPGAAPAAASATSSPRRARPRARPAARAVRRGRVSSSWSRTSAPTTATRSGAPPSAARTSTGTATTSISWPRTRCLGIIPSSTLRRSAVLGRRVAITASVSALSFILAGGGSGT